MSEDPTQNLEQKYQTGPTIQTVLERLDEFRGSMGKRFDALENRIDRVESVALATRSELLDLRADFREFRAEVRGKLKEPA
jgi:hypothetical protein